MKANPSMNRHGRGGAWKVAYADFVTALMALFIVLWMMNASATVKRSVAGYFRDPRRHARESSSGPAAPAEGQQVNRQAAASMQQTIEQALHAMPGFDKLGEQVKLSVTGEGLRIDLLENEQGMFFVTGSAEPTVTGQTLLNVLAQELSRMPNSIVVEGHTDSLPFRNARPERGYSNWELSTDRANAARRQLCSGGVPPGRIVEVRGFADQKLLEPAAPENPRNRRISIMVLLTDE
jgi:chemotaxis protein MotB